MTDDSNNKKSSIDGAFAQLEVLWTSAPPMVDHANASLHLIDMGALLTLSLKRDEGER